ncbi:hypothetical protein [Mycobacteroides abscessus]|uniref:hypothetical protein n=1 Tax=Mycobacteroides abscessus TaxID=36809 RepID=UPI00070A491E|nr:hypothetical protein [Mycobacteroides abscessus]ALM19118.1 hypothetical protein AOY11_25435 [Mycobacteroides abscessus]AMU52120.1 hypothetical protein A3O01_19635 [Mycobacteroides abscessus]ANO10804.1 hypothetical protein BAB76_19645 [Mycobacteroides abscessus]MDM3924299.1 hypothetical protein [Mycobacteroides abscessus]MDO2967237.1 hypothetical protein [Mycobacteroides abscessus subsp. abscessus]
MSIGLIALTPFAVLLGYLCWQLIRKASARRPDLGGRRVSDGAPGYSPGAGGDTGTFGFFGGFGGGDSGSGGGYCDSGGFSDGGGGCDGGG